MTHAKKLTLLTSVKKKHNTNHIHIVNCGMLCTSVKTEAIFNGNRTFAFGSSDVSFIQEVLNTKNVKITSQILYQIVKPYELKSFSVFEFYDATNYDIYST